MEKRKKVICGISVGILIFVVISSIATYVVYGKINPFPSYSNKMTNNFKGCYSWEKTDLGEDCGDNIICVDTEQCIQMRNKQIFFDFIFLTISIFLGIVIIGLIESHKKT